MKKMKKYKRGSFSTVEIIISISIMLILGGMVLLNYGLQRDKMELNNAANSVVQAIRKVQDLALGQSARPSTCSSDSGTKATNFAAYFKKEENKVTLYADKDVSGNECSFEEVFFSPTIKISSLNPAGSSFEEVFFSPTIKISSLNPAGSSNDAWVSFYIQDLSVKINNSSATSLTITLCIKSSCTTNNTKTIKVNNKGMVEVQ